MTIPHDALNRWWVEVSAANPNEVDRLRPGLLAFLPFGPGREASFEESGIGFVIAGGPDFALVLTAKHVVTGLGRKQRPPRSYAHLPFVPFHETEPSLEPEKLKVLWMCSTHASMMNVLHVGYNQTLDIACCMVAPQDEQDPPFQPVSLPIDTAVPVLGDVAHMVSLENMTVEEHIPPTDASGTGQVLAVTRRVSIRVGVVTGVYLGEFRQYKWPCFTTSIPAEPGMSGGLVTLPRDGNTIGACGIVCADNSTPEARSNPLQCGESVIACAWTALSLRTPDWIPPTATTPASSLYEMMQTGRMDIAIGGIDHIALVEKENGDCTMQFR
jgi:hypothetical protein